MTNPRASETGDRAGSASGVLAMLTSSPLQLALRFGVSGVTTTLIYFFLTNALVLVFGISPVASSVSSYLVSVVISYLLQSRFAFRVKDDGFDQIVRFVVTSLAGLAVSWCVMAFAVGLMHWPYLWGAIGVCVVVPILNFFVLRGWVFAARRDGDAVTGDRS
ncbi:MAG: GtrA family protein [bacterium]|nr:GtrA family protein [bacterium]